MKAAARRLSNKTLTTQSSFTGLNKGASEQIPDELLTVERLGVAREILPPRNISAWQPGTLGSQVDQFCEIGEPVTAKSHEPDSYLEVETGRLFLRGGDFRQCK